MSYHTHPKLYTLVLANAEKRIRVKIMLLFQMDMFCASERETWWLQT